MSIRETIHGPWIERLKDHLEVEKYSPSATEKRLAAASRSWFTCGASAPELKWPRSLTYGLIWNAAPLPQTPWPPAKRHECLALGPDRRHP
jgi:hypothetical protein